MQPQCVRAFVYVLESEIAPRKAEQWLTQVPNDENLRKGMPAFELRSMLIGQNGSGAKQQLRKPFLADLIVESFKVFSLGQHPLALGWRRAERPAYRNPSRPSGNSRHVIRSAASRHSQSAALGASASLC